LIVRGGWPNTVEDAPEQSQKLLKSYLKSICKVEKLIDNRERINEFSMLKLISSLARNEGCQVSVEKLINESGLNRNNISVYLGILERKHIFFPLQP
jgi:predicted AAA+ superfamily ATPase